MKYLFVILVSVLFASCNQEELQKHNEAYFIDLIKNQIEENDRLVQDALLATNENGNHLIDKEVYQEMMELQVAREKLLEQALLSNFEYFSDTLIDEYQVFINKVCEENDSFAVMEVVQQELIPIQEFNQLEKMPNKFEKIIWAYQCMNLEHELLWRSLRELGSCSFGAGTKVHTFSDTNPQIDEPYEILISSIPLRFEGTRNYDGEHYTVMYSFEFQIDGVETEIKYQIERIEDVGILRFSPTKNGNYRIWGRFYARYDNNDHHRTLYKMTHIFEVN